MSSTRDELSAVSDEDLLARYVAGDFDAFGVLLERYERPLFGFVRRLVRDWQLAEDVYQDVFVRVIHEATRFDARLAFAPWLFRIARNRCIDVLRRQTHRRAFRLDIRLAGEDDSSGSDQQVPIAAAADRSPAEIVEDKEMRARVDAAIQQLDPQRREALLLKEFAGLTFREAALVGGVPESTLKSRYQAAIQDLAAILRRWDVMGDGRTQRIGG